MFTIDFPQIVDLSKVHTIKTTNLKSFFNMQMPLVNLPKICLGGFGWSSCTVNPIPILLKYGRFFDAVNVAKGKDSQHFGNREVSMATQPVADFQAAAKIHVAWRIQTSVCKIYPPINTYKGGREGRRERWMEWKHNNELFPTVLSKSIMSYLEFPTY